MSLSPTALAEGEHTDLVAVQLLSVKTEVAGKSPTRIAMERLVRDKVAIACSAILLLLVLAAIFAPLICKAMNIYHDGADPNAPSASSMVDIFNANLPLYGPPLHGFDIHHPLGLAPNTGLDNFAVLLYGLRASLIVSTSATVLTTIGGLAAGLIAGYSRGFADKLIAFLVDLFMSFPLILGAIAIAPIIISRFGSHESTYEHAQMATLIVIFSVLGWMYLARLVRGQVLSLREREFVQAAQVMGVPQWQILFKELLPNLMPTIVVYVSMTLPGFVGAEVGLSFLGIGLSNSMGTIVDTATSWWNTYPLYFWAPVVTITLLVLVLNLLGDSIRDAFDPRTRR